MTEFIKDWWARNGGVIIGTLIGLTFGGGVGGIIWGINLDGRVKTIEVRGSPAVEALERRLTRVEERQNTVIDTLKTNSGKLDNIANELIKHEIETKK